MVWKRRGLAVPSRRTDGRGRPRVIVATATGSVAALWHENAPCPLRLPIARHRRRDILGVLLKPELARLISH